MFLVVKSVKWIVVGNVLSVYIVCLLVVFNVCNVFNIGKNLCLIKLSYFYFFYSFLN